MLAGKALKTVLVGSMAVGKTALFDRLRDSRFEGVYHCTIGSDYFDRDIKIGDQLVKLQIWDTAGMDRFRALGPVYYRDASAAVFVFDVTRDDTFTDLEEWVASFEATVGCPFFGVVVGNKIDLLSDETTTARMKAWAHSKGFAFALTSAKTGENVEEMFSRVAEGALEAVRRRPGEINAIAQSEASSSCC